MTYYEKIKQIRQNNGMSQEQMAQLLGTSQQYYGQYELGKRPLPVNHLITICKYFNVSADHILGLRKR